MSHSWLNITLISNRMKLCSGNISYPEDQKSALLLHICSAKTLWLLFSNLTLKELIERWTYISTWIVGWDNTTVRQIFVIWKSALYTLVGAKLDTKCLSYSLFLNMFVFCCNFTQDYSISVSILSIGFLAVKDVNVLLERERSEGISSPSRDDESTLQNPATHSSILDDNTKSSLGNQEVSGATSPC